MKYLISEITYEGNMKSKTEGSNNMLVKVVSIFLSLSLIFWVSVPVSFAVANPFDTPQSDPNSTTSTVPVDPTLANASLDPTLDPTVVVNNSDATLSDPTLPTDPLIDPLIAPSTDTSISGTDPLADPLPLVTPTDNTNVPSTDPTMTDPTGINPLIDPLLVASNTVPSTTDNTTPGIDPGLALRQAEVDAAIASGQIDPTTPDGQSAIQKILTGMGDIPVTDSTSSDSSTNTANTNGTTLTPDPLSLPTDQSGADASTQVTDTSSSTSATDTTTVPNTTSDPTTDPNSNVVTDPATTGDTFDMQSFLAAVTTADPTLISDQIQNIQAFANGEQVTLTEQEQAAYDKAVKVMFGQTQTTVSSGTDTTQTNNPDTTQTTTPGQNSQTVNDLLSQLNGQSNQSNFQAPYYTSGQNAASSAPADTGGGGGSTGATGSYNSDSGSYGGSRLSDVGMPNASEWGSAVIPVSLANRIAALRKMLDLIEAGQMQLLIQFYKEIYALVGLIRGQGFLVPEALTAMIQEAQNFQITHAVQVEINSQNQEVDLKKASIVTEEEEAPKPEIAKQEPLKEQAVQANEQQQVSTKTEDDFEVNDQATDRIQEAEHIQAAVTLAQKNMIVPHVANTQLVITPVVTPVFAQQSSSGQTN